MRCIVCAKLSATTHPKSFVLWYLVVRQCTIQNDEFAFVSAALEVLHHSIELHDSHNSETVMNSGGNIWKSQGVMRGQLSLRACLASTTTAARAIPGDRFNI